MLKDEDLDLRGRREQARLNLSELGHLLDLHPTQVSRYEQNPENTPFRIVRAWLAACGEVRVKAGVDFGDPYAPLHAAIGRISNHGVRQPELKDGDTHHPLGVADALAAVRQLSRKPRIVLSGRFDAGKSRLINVLMGQDRLPSAYRPATRLVCFVRHIDDKPIWQREDIWIFGEGFTPDHLDDREGSERYRLVAGDSETLTRFNDDPRLLGSTAGEAVAATVYVDAPILRVCDFVDTPGLGDSERDDQLGKSIYGAGDAILYLSPINGFLNAEDTRALGTLLQALPQRDDEPALRRLFVLATHAHSDVSEAEINKALDAAADATIRRLGPAVTRFLRVGDTAAAQALRLRMFPWYVERADRRVAFEHDLQELLRDRIPRLVATQADEAIATFLTKAEATYQAQIETMDQFLDEQEAAAARLAELEEQVPAIFSRLDLQGRQVEKFVSRVRIETRSFVEGYFAYRFGTDADAGAQTIEAWIRSNFSSAEEAEQHAGNRLLAEFEADIVDHLNGHSEILKIEIEQLLEIYAAGQKNLKFGGLAVPFDARAAFLGALAAGGIFGALSVWAAAVAGGNNLGAWLLVPQVVGLLSRLGIGIAGGAASGVSVVAALGGPVVIGVAIALAVGLVAWQVFGRSWQSKLARQIAEGVRGEKLDLKNFVQQRCDDYWGDTLQAFHSAAEATKAAFLNEIEELRAKQTVPREELISRRARLERYRQYLSFLPWSPLSGGSTL